jgi:hypothetical protein
MMQATIEKLTLCHQLQHDAGVERGADFLSPATTDAPPKEQLK